MHSLRSFRDLGNDFASLVVVFCLSEYNFRYKLWGECAHGMCVCTMCLHQYFPILISLAQARRFDRGTCCGNCLLCCWTWSRWNFINLRSKWINVCSQPVATCNYRCWWWVARSFDRGRGDPKKTSIFCVWCTSEQCVNDDNDMGETDSNKGVNIENNGRWSTINIVIEFAQNLTILCRSAVV